MNTIKKTLTSRTVWSIVALVLVNGVPSIQNLIPVDWQPVVDAVLGLLAIYFRTNPSVKF